MAAKFDDKKRKQIIADYIELESISAVARLHECSRTAVRNIVNSSSDIDSLFQEKKEQNTKDVLAHMEKRTEDACNVIDVFLDALKDKERLRRANILQIATAMGIVIDKFTNLSLNSDNGRIDELIKGLTNGK